MTDQQIPRRIHSYVESMADDLFADQLAEWARSDDGTMPLRTDALADARD